MMQLLTAPWKNLHLCWIWPLQARCVSQGRREFCCHGPMLSASRGLPSCAVSRTLLAISIRGSCCQEVEARLVLQWQAAVQQNVSHRKGFAGLAGCDAHLTRLIFGRLESEYKALARKSLNGSFFTQDALCHFSEGESDACAFCGHPDSVLHRVFECPHFQDARALPLSCALSVLEAQCDATRLHCWAPCVKDVGLLRHALCQLPDTTSHFEPLPPMPIYDLFTDGSCLCSCFPSLRLALGVSWWLRVPLTRRACPCVPGLYRACSKPLFGRS